jgi:ADP-ribose pyrophosphatase
VAIEKVALPNGSVIDEFLQLKGRDFVVIVPFTDDGRIVTIRSYKHGPRRVSLSLPAGLLDGDEEPEQAARRELLEETGYEAAGWERIGSFVVESNYGLNTEHAFIARGARKVREPRSGDLEEMVVEVHSRDELVAAIRAGDVAQLSSAAAIGLALALGR